MDGTKVGQKLEHTATVTNRTLNSFWLWTLLLHLTAPFTFAVERCRTEREVEQGLMLFPYCDVPHVCPPAPCVCECGGGGRGVVGKKVQQQYSEKAMLLRWLCI
jgi:hypothetical protein